MIYLLWSVGNLYSYSEGFKPVGVVVGRQSIL